MKTIAFKLNDLDDDNLVGFYKAFSGDLEGAYEIFRKKKDREMLCMIGDFYLDEAEECIKRIDEMDLGDPYIIDLLLRRPLDIYIWLHDTANIRRIASDYSNMGLEGSAEESLRKYYDLKKEGGAKDLVKGKRDSGHHRRYRRLPSL